MKIGWIGCGTHAGEMLLPQLARLGVKIAALADVDSSRLEIIAGRHGVAAADCYTDALALIARKDIDAVGMAIGPKAHLELGVAALESGLPVFMEKPPGANAKDARRLEAASRKSGKPLVLGFMKRYSTANRIALNIVHGGEFGAPASFFGEYMTAPTYFKGDPDYSGFYLHHCVHYMDLVPHLMGKPVELHARRHELAPGKLLLHVDFRFVSGGLGTLVMGTNQSRATPMEWWQVMGDHRRVEVRNVHEVRYFRAPQFKVDDLAATLSDDVDTLVWEPNLTVAANEDHKGYHALLGDFVARVEGRPSTAPEIGDGVAAMAVLDAMIASADSGRAIKLD
jgi:myo-inositol 2-dehydrogenase/D-chiro-inositol 1-dehydrogenase